MIRKLVLLLTVVGLAQGKMAPKSFLPRHALSVRGGSDAADAVVDAGSSLLDPGMVSKAGIAMNILQGVYGAVAPEKSGEMYGIDRPSALHTLILERVCIAVLSVGLQAYWLTVKESSLAEAVGVAAFPWVVSICKSLVSGTPNDAGIPQAGELLNLAIAGGVTYVGLTDASSFDAVFKVFGIWLCANGVFLGFMPKDAGNVWGIKSPSDGETFQLKVLGYWLLALGVFDVALTRGVEGLTAYGYSWIPVAALSLMINFVSKEVGDLKMDSTPQYIWMLVEAVMIGTLAV